MKVKALIISGILLALALLAFAVQGFVRELLLYPLVYLYWSIRLVYEGVPGSIWWGIAIALLVLLALRSLSRGRPGAAVEENYTSISLTRPQTWTRRIKKTRHGEYFKWQLAREISQLALAHVANNERLTPEQTREKLALGQLNLPPQIQAYLAAGALTKSYGNYTQTEHKLRLPDGASPLDLEPEDIASFLEANLERNETASHPTRRLH